MKKRRVVFQKTVSLITGFLLVFQSLTPGFFISSRTFAQDATITETPSPTPVTTPEPTAEPTIVQTVEPTAKPTVTTPEPTTVPTITETPTPTEEITPTIEPTTTPPNTTPTEEPKNNSPPATDETGEILDGISTDIPAERSATPTITASNTASPETGELQAIILDNVAAPTLNLDGVNPDGSASLSTDKADYAPTDTAIISGKDFTPGKTYQLTISSTDDPATSTTVGITADDKGTFIYAYQLDGKPRLNYKVEAKANEEMVASVTFTDPVPVDDTGFASPSSEHNPNEWSHGDRAYSSNDSYTTEGSEGNEQAYDDFSLPSIPTGSTIQGIEVKIEAKSSDSSGCSMFVKLSWDNGSHYTAAQNTTSLSNSDSDYTLGGSTETWGRTWSAGNFTNSNFVLKMYYDDTPPNTNCENDDTTVSVDHVQAKVYYTAPPPAVCGDGIKNGTEECDGTDGVANADLRCTSTCKLELIAPKVTICHSNSSHTNPYVKQEPDKSADVSGHNGHNGGVYPADPWGDIIPSFTYIGGTFPGKNWTAEGQAIWNNNCEVPCDTTYTYEKTSDFSNAAVTIDFDHNHHNQATITAENGFTLISILYDRDGDGESALDDAWPVDSNTETIIAENDISAIRVVIKKVCAIVCGNNKLESGEQCDDGNTANGDGCNSTCQIEPTTLTLVKTVINDHGGNALNTAWTLSANGTTHSFSGTTPVSGTVDATVTYTLSESGGPSGYIDWAWDCDGGTKVGNTITLEAADNVTCTITNDDLQPSLTITKIVNGGTLQVTDFPLFVDTTPVASGVRTAFNAGSYVVSETQQNGYTGVISGDCDAEGNITLGLGERKSCTITNTLNSYCGDGIIDTNKGEQCDGTSGVTAGSNFCTNSCKLIPVYNGGTACSSGKYAFFRDSYSIDSANPTGTSIPVESGKEYLFASWSDYGYGGAPLNNELNRADPAFATRDNWATTLDGVLGIGPSAQYRGVTSLVSDMGTGTVGVVNWGGGVYNPGHNYNFSYTPVSTENVQFLISDWYNTWYSGDAASEVNKNQAGMWDNNGSLALAVYECLPSSQIRIQKNVNDSSEWHFDLTAQDGKDYDAGGYDLGNGHFGSIPVPSGNYTITETPAPGVIGSYTSSYRCADLPKDFSGEIQWTLTGTGTSATFDIAANRKMWCEFTNTLVPPCGNGVINDSEQCDDGNTTPGDGCSATCQIETGTLRVQKTVNIPDDLADWEFKLDNGSWIRANDTGLVDFGAVTTGNHTITEKTQTGYYLHSVTGCTPIVANNNSATATVTANQTTTCVFNNYAIPVYTGTSSCPTTAPIKNLLHTYTIGAKDADGEVLSGLTAGNYLFEATGSFNPTSASGYVADAAYTTINGSLAPQYGIHGTAPDYGAHALLANLGSGVGIVDWGSYNEGHNYSRYLSSPANPQFLIGDRYLNWYGTPYDNQSGMSDNDGNLTLKVYECVAPKGTIEIRKVILPADTSTYWNFGIDAGYTFWDTWKTNGYSSGQIEVTPGNHSVVEQTAPGTDGTKYSSTLVCKDGETVVANGGPASLVYGQNLVSTNFNVVADQHIICTFTNTKKGTIEIKKIISPSDTTNWNFGIDGGYTLWETQKTNGYSSGQFGVIPGRHSVVEQVGYNGEPINGFTDGSKYTSSLVCKDGENIVATAGPVSLPYGNNLASPEFDVASDQHIICTFTNTKNGSISGQKFNDSNGNGVKDSGEPGIVGWPINLIQNDYGVATLYTDANGNYAFTNVTPGTYDICEGMYAGWQETYPTTGFDCPIGKGYEVTVSAGDQISGEEFGNFQLGSISGQKFNDMDGDGVKEPGEPGLAGWTIWLDKNNNNLLDGGDITTTTDANGNYSFSNLTVGTYHGYSYGINEVQQSDWTQTYPVDTTHYVTLLSGTNATGIDFGNFKLGYIQGKKFNDLNNNGQEDSGEPVINSWPIRLYNASWNPAAPEQTTHFISGYGNGRYRFENLNIGTYYICEVSQSGWTQTDPGNTEAYLNQSSATDEAPRCRKAIINQSGQQIEGKLFGNIHLGTITIDKATNPQGDAQSFDFTAKKDDTAVDTFSLTDADTAHTSTYLAGHYTISEATNAQWEPGDISCQSTGGISNLETHASLTNPPARVSFDLAAGGNVTCTFNNIKYGTVNVRKYDDEDDDGTKDETEKYLSGWEMTLTGYDPKQTDANGIATFSGLSQGNYVVGENMKPLWKQTKIDCTDGTQPTPTPTDTPSGCIPDGNVCTGDRVSNGCCSGECINGSCLIRETFNPFVEQVHAQKIEVASPGSITVNPGETVNCLIGNHYSPPVLEISKENDTAGLDMSPGASILYTLILHVLDNNISHVNLIDLLPQGFTYRLGSWTASITGGSFDHSITEPTYASPGTWNLGDLTEGSEITLTLTADVSTDEKPGLYKDLALAYGCQTDEPCSIVAASAVTPGDIGEPNHVGTQVNIVKDQQDNKTLSVVHEETGSVLGASTELPATGANANWIIVALSFIITGLGAVVVSSIMRRYHA